MNPIFAFMRYGIVLIYLLATGCQLNERLDRLDQGRKKADFFLDHLQDSVKMAALAADPTMALHVRNFTAALAERCDWAGRRGTFIDFYMHRSGDERRVTYIYEYFLDCDSVRVLLTYDTGSDSVVIHTAHLEPIELDNPWLVDPMKSIIKNKDWEKRK